MLCISFKAVDQITDIRSIQYCETNCQKFYSVFWKNADVRVYKSRVTFVSA